jgi:hypothetical protein
VARTAEPPAIFILVGGGGAARGAEFLEVKSAYDANTPLYAYCDPEGYYSVYICLLTNVWGNRLLAYSILKTEAVGSSEALVSTYQTAPNPNPRIP